MSCCKKIMRPLLCLDKCNPDHSFCQPGKYKILDRPLREKSSLLFSLEPKFTTDVKLPTIAIYSYGSPNTPPCRGGAELPGATPLFA